MARRIFVSLALSISCALLLAACGGADNTTNGTSNTTNANRAANTSTSTNVGNTTVTTSNSGTTVTATVSSDKVGVPECDDYLAKLEACITGKVPEAARAQYQASMEQTRKSWREMAGNPQTKAGLAQACKMAVDASKQTYKTFGCDF